MERIEFFIYLVIFIAIVFLVIKHRKTGRKD
jgi:hypothetical protein